MTETKSKIIPINVDRNVSFRDYRHIEGRSLLVAENGIFYTFQGEGPFAGHPCVFLRLAGCNIGAKEDCPWCDTKFHFDKGDPVPIDEVLALINAKAQNKTKLIIITGGEPLLQKASLEVFWQQARASGWHVQVETNGYFVDSETLIGADIVVSPKIPHNRRTYLPIKPDWLMRRVSLKYVVTADEGSPYHLIPNDAIAARYMLKGLYISAMCVYKRTTNPGEIPNIWDGTLVDQDETMMNYAYAAEYALDLGVKVSYQTHLFGVKE